MKLKSNPFLVALLMVVAHSGDRLSAASLYWKTSTAASWDGSSWSAAAGGPSTQAWVSGSDVVFEDNLGVALTIKGPAATTNFNSILANENVTVTASSTLGTGGTVAVVDVAAGKVLDFAGQSVSTAAGTGFIKNGGGTWSLSGGTYAGGFTLNAGTIAVGGVNAMGAGGALTLNAGTVRSSSTAARDLSGKYTAGITLGGNVTLGDATTNGALTFTNNIALGASTRTLTVNSAVSLGGVISGASGAGLSKSGPGVLTLGGANTYTGATSINAGALSITGTGALPGFSTNGSYSVASGAALAVYNAVTDGNIASMLATTNFAADSSLGFDTTTAARTYSVNLTNTTQGNLGLIKLGTNTLTLSGTNTYSGGTVISQPNDANGIIATTASALGTGSVLVNGAQNFSAGLAVNSGLTITNALTLKRGSGGSNRALLSLGASSIWSGNITLDGTTASGFAGVMTGGTTAGTACLISGNIGFSTLGTATSAFPTFVLRSSNSFGRISGSVSLSTGYVQLLDSSKWEFSNPSNTWATLDISNASAIASVGATNTLPAGGIVTSTVGGTLQLNNQAATTAYSQKIAGLGGNVKVALSTGAATLTLDTASDQSNSGVISGAISLVKSGTAKQTLTGANTYTGSTTINGGTLALGTTGAISSGDLSISSATLDLRKGTSTRVSNVANLSLNNAVLDVGLNANPDGLNVTGAASISGSNTIKLHGTIAAGTYTLISTPSPLTGTFVLDTSGVTVSGFTGSYTADIDGNNYVLTVGGTPTPYLAYWNGDVSSVWNDSSVAPGSNWATDSSGTEDTAQVPGAITDVYFSTAGATNTTTTLGADLSINSLTFETGTTTVGGANTLSILTTGGNALDVLAGASATLSTATTAISGTAAVQEGGTLTVNSGGLGSGTLLVDGVLNLNSNTTNAVLNGGSTGVISRGTAGTSTLGVSGSANSNYAGSLNDGTGVVAVSKGGASTLTLSGASTYSGGTVISGGIVKANSSSALGSGTVAINGGQRLSLGEGVTVANAITIGTNTSPQGAGILEGSSTVTTSATLTGPISITSGPAGGGHFINNGTGTFEVKSAITSTVAVIHRNGTVTYWGGGTGYNAMSVTGTARLGANNGLATTAVLTVGVSGAGTLDLAGYNQSLPSIVKDANAATVGNSSTTADSLLTITGTSTFNGVIKDTLGSGTRKTGLVVSGGTLTLGGVNTYTGNTTVNSGALTLSDNAQLKFAIGATSGTNNSLTGASATLNGDFNIDTTLADASALTSGSWTLENVTSLTGAYGATFQVLSGTTPWTATGDKWSKTVGAKTYTFDEATGILTLASGGYDSWASSKGLTGTDANFDADPDHDGLNNGLEFVLGGEPNPANPGSNSASLLPTVAQTAGDLIFTFKRKDLSESGVALVFQWSTDLSFPTPASNVPVGATDSTTDSIVVDVTEDSPDVDTDTIVITVPAAKAAGGKLFGRLMASKLP